MKQITRHGQTNLALLAHAFLAEVITPEDTVVDATMGNGHDTEFLARLSANVFGFDVQDAAIAATRGRLAKSGLAAELVKDGHENIDKYVSAPIKAAIFNLGFLPGSDKQVITKPDTTVAALEKLTRMLAPQGRIAVTVYPGHDGGKSESDAVQGFVGELDKSKWHVAAHHSPHRTDISPFVICVRKL